MFMKRGRVWTSFSVVSLSAPPASVLKIYLWESEYPSIRIGIISNLCRGACACVWKWKRNEEWKWARCMSFPENPSKENTAVKKSGLKERAKGRKANIVSEWELKTHTRNTHTRNILIMLKISGYFWIIYICFPTRCIGKFLPHTRKASRNDNAKISYCFELHFGFLSLKLKCFRNVFLQKLKQNKVMKGECENENENKTKAKEQAKWNVFNGQSETMMKIGHRYMARTRNERIKCEQWRYLNDLEWFQWWLSASGYGIKRVFKKFSNCFGYITGNPNSKGTILFGDSNYFPLELANIIFCSSFSVRFLPKQHFTYIATSLCMFYWAPPLFEFEFVLWCYAIGASGSGRQRHWEQPGRAGVLNYKTPKCAPSELNTLAAHRYSCEARGV